MTSSSVLRRTSSLVKSLFIGNTMRFIDISSPISSSGGKLPGHRGAGKEFLGNAEAIDEFVVERRFEVRVQNDGAVVKC